MIALHPDDEASPDAPHWQRSLASVEAGTETWDAMIVGGGPAGTMTALRLAANGHRVLLLERHRYPRDKACGDALMPDAMRALRRNGLFERVAAHARRVTHAVGFSPSRIRFEFAGEFMCVKRAVLDAELAAAASEAGVQCAQARVRRVWEEQELVLAEVADGLSAVRARVAVVATGADVTLLREHGMVEREAPSAVAVRCYVRAPADLDALAFSLDREIIPGYAWIFPLAGDEFNIGLGIIDRSGIGDATHDLKRLLQTFLERFPLARDLMASATATSPVRGARLRCGLTGTRPTNGSRIVAVGESIGATYPFSGEGIGKAMETAELAADAVHVALSQNTGAPLAAYAARLEHELSPRYLGYEVAERWLAHRWVSDFLAGRARRSARVRDAIAALIDERIDPRRIFSLRGLASSLFA